MPKAALSAVLERRKSSIWTKIHPIFALGQLLAFFVSIGFLIAYLRGAVPFHDVHVSVMVKIGLMVGAVITGALWEHDVYGHWWFAPEFLVEDVMTLIVFITQISYIIMVYTHPGQMNAILCLLGLAYLLYFGNVAQYIHRTQRMKKDERIVELDKAA
jgi:3-vinyl bacteriochlorophyllide hydratase